MKHLLLMILLFNLLHIDYNVKAQLIHTIGLNCDSVIEQKLLEAEMQGLNYRIDTINLHDSGFQLFIEMSKDNKVQYREIIFIEENISVAEALTKWAFTDSTYVNFYNKFNAKKDDSHFELYDFDNTKIYSKYLYMDLWIIYWFTKDKDYCYELENYFENVVNNYYK